MRTPKDWGQPCPHPACTHDRRMQQGHVSALATSLTHSGKRRLFRCHTGATHFSETREPVFFALRTAAEKVMRALKMLLVRMDLAGLGFVLGVTEEAVWAWLRRAAPQAEALHRHLRRALPVPHGPLDERWNGIARQHARETDEAGDSVPDGEEGRQGGWVRFAPACHLLIAAVVGPRTLAMAQEVMAVTTARGAGLPAFCSDGFPGSLAALSAAWHVVPTWARTGKRGRPRQPLWAPHPELVYGQVVTPQKPGQRLTLSPRVVLGAERLTHLGLTVRTAVVERVNLTLRQALAPFVRQTPSVCNDRERLRQRVVFCQAFSHVARPHMSWRQPLPLHERQRHGAIRPRWRERTPARAAALTDHLWTLRELLTINFEPLDSQSMSG